MGLPQRRGLGIWRTDVTLSLDRVHRQNECADRLRAGDPTALEELLDEYWEPIVRYVTRLLDDRDAGHDVAQMTFVRLWQIRSTLVPTLPLAAILYRTARSFALDARRQERTRRFGRVARFSSEAPRPITPSEAVERAELHDAIERALRSLSARRREVFTLYHFHNLSYRQIAEVMGVTPQVVANYMSAALGELRAALAPEIGDYLRDRRLE